jgi:redox-sensitive bicupin YhaK (pirin superfamily)
VNLPAKNKMVRPGYQAILNTAIPSLNLLGGAVSVRVIAGNFGDVKGPAKTFTPNDRKDWLLITGFRGVTRPANKYMAKFHRF